jgi:hypothetical protein
MLRLRYQVRLFCRRADLPMRMGRSEERQRPYVRGILDSAEARRGRATAAARRD